MSFTNRVTFDTNVKVNEILTIYDFTASEISAAWYDENEMEKITQRCFKILHKVESAKSNNSTKYCMRGLEGHTTLGSISKKRNRSEAYAAVFNEQERHWNNDEDIRIQAMSDAYRRTSSSCQMWTQVVGSRDEQAVEGYLYDDGGQDDVVETSTEERLVVPTSYSQASTPCPSARKMLGASNNISLSPRTVTIF